MRESLTPEKIQKDVLIGDLGKENAAELLISLIEGSDNIQTRVESIKALKKINVQSEKIFKILEHCLISDESAVVRASVAEFIINYFPEHGQSALTWVIKHENSPLVLKKFFDSLDRFNVHELAKIKEELFNWNEIYSAKIGVVPDEAIFFLDLEVLFAKGKMKYNIDPYWFKHFTKLSNIRNGEPWLVIEDKHVVILNFNFYNWNWIKENLDIVNSLYKLKYLDVYFDSIHKYNYIDDKNNNLEIPKSIGNLTYLKKLILKKNKICRIPESIVNLNFLKELDLSYNQLQEIPHLIKFLKSLEKLNLKHNKFEQIPDYLKSFSASLKNFEI